MKIAGLARSSTVDFPGQLAAVIFSPGCNYNCFYCHNRSIISGNAAVLDIEEVKKFLKKRSGLLDGVVFSGGEATLQNDIQEFMYFCKILGYKIKLDTNGSTPETLDKLLKSELLDYVAMDYKAPFEKYRQICGKNADPEKVKESLSLLFKSKATFELRTTVVPQLGAEDIITMAKEVPVIPKYTLNGYRVPEEFLPEDAERINQRRHTKEELCAFIDAIIEFQPNTILGTF